MKNQPLGELLKDLGFITEYQLREVLEYQKIHSHLRIGAALIELGFITEKQLIQTLAQQLEIKVAEVDRLTVDIEAVQLIPRQLAEKYVILAIKLSGNLLTIVTSDPLNFYALEDIRQITEKTLDVQIGESASLKKAIEYYYSEVTAQRAMQTANQTTVVDAGKFFSEAMVITDAETSDAPTIRLIDSLIQRAYTMQASDIHLEPFEDETAIRMRVDGVMIEYMNLQKSLHPSLMARIKIMANLDITEKRLPQDGHFRTRLEREDLNVRVSMIPTVFGEKAVLRLLAKNATIDHSGQFGMNEDAYKRFLPMLDFPNGIIYITGPTGSGKSTTLYMVLEYLARRNVNISTIEDPVEKNIKGINQTQTNPVAGLTFETGLRALLRQDPDIIMVGETRDAETASISVRAAITGHIVFSTLHTNNATSSIVRLRDMGLENYLIANSLVGLVAQRLMRKNCLHCREEIEVTPIERKWLPPGIQHIFHSKGCPSCKNTGFSGRIAVHEVVGIDKELRGMIARNAPMDEVDAYARNVQGMKTLLEQGLDLLRQGIIPYEEVLKLIYYV
jgi:type IV pilus assembly protein PilB